MRPAKSGSTHFARDNPPAAGSHNVSATHLRLSNILGDKAGARAEYESAVSLEPKKQLAKDAIKRLESS